MSRRPRSSSDGTIAPPAHDPMAIPEDGSTSVTEEWTARILILLAFGFAIVFHTLFFHRAELIGGDIRYHRGVALTMSAGNFQGEGPIHGLLSYYGGLYPFVFGWTSRILGVSFDTVVSVASWIAAPLLPMSLLYLGRSIFPSKRQLEIALLVFLGTIGSSLNTEPFARWVYSVLPSGTGEFPVFPRDIALLLLITALGITLRADSNRRRAAAAFLAAITISFHAQIGMYAAAALIGVEAWRLVPARRFGALVLRSGVITFVAAAGSAWWWIPRVDAAITSKQLLLANYPGTPSADVSPLGLLVALGPLGVLALPGIWFAWRGSKVTRLFGCWLLAFVPFIGGSQLLGDVNVLTGRRALFFAAVPLVVCATMAAASAVRRLGPAMTVIMVLAVGIPSGLEVWTTRDLVSRWDDAHAGPLFRTDMWSEATTQLRDRVVRNGSTVVIAPDSDGVFIWAQTGAQPYSLLLPGSIKLGFDPGPLTGTGYLERVKRSDRAFRSGIPGICRLARTAHAGMVILRHHDGMLGTHDLRPSARWRVPPETRSSTTINRVVAPGVHYVDRSSLETLTMTAGGSYPLRWTAPGVRFVEVFLAAWAPSGKTASLVFPDGTTIEPTVTDPVHLRYATPNGVPPGARLVVHNQIAIDRIIGYEPWSAGSVAGTEYQALAIPVTRLCPTKKGTS